MYTSFSFVYIVCVHVRISHTVSLSQARDIRTNEVVAIKKMSYSGKQSNEVSVENPCEGIKKPKYD